jgi:prepilin-type N-terminal cleavage/methylation domain-containing protein
MTSGTGCNRGPNRRAGFTLIELSIVVFILLIIVAASIPYYAKAYRSSLLNSGGRSLVTMTQLARLEAVLRQHPSTLHLDLEEDKFWVSQTQTNDFDPDAQVVVKLVKLETPVGIVSAAVGEGEEGKDGTMEIRFYPNGTCDPAKIVLRGADRGAGLELELDPVTTRATVTPVKL